MIVHTQKDTYNKDLDGVFTSDQTTGVSMMDKKEIHVLAVEFDNGMYDLDGIFITIWHEIGHFVERYAITSTKENEVLSSLFEFVRPIAKQMEKIEKMLDKTLGGVKCQKESKT